MDGNELRQVLSQAQNRITIVAPFIKVSALRYLLGEPDGRQLTVYTRWLPTEVALGVSDLEVLDLVSAEWGGQVWLLRELHAKAFIADERAFVGSANVTASALGWSSHPNLELVTEVDSRNADVSRLIAELEGYSFRATEEVRELVRRAAKDLQQDANLLVEWSASTNGLPDLAPPTQALEEPPPRRQWLTVETDDQRLWIPETGDPERFVAYHAGTGRFSLEEAAAGADRDLSFLQVSPALPVPAFVAGVRAALSQVAIVRVIRSVFNAGGDESAAFEAFCSSAGLDPENEVAEGHWTTAVNWLLHFFPDEFDYASTGQALMHRQGGSLGSYG